MAGYCSIGPGPKQKFKRISKYAHWSQLEKYEKGNSRVSKISKHCTVKDKYKRNIYPFEKKYRFPTKFKLKI
jgi:hypothetical protein